VLSHLEGASQPASHAEIVDALGPFGFDRATVYRNLMDLTEAGLVARSDLGDHVWRFERRRRSEGHNVEHPHFVCTDCGAVACLPGGTVRIVSGQGVPRSVGTRAVEVQLKGRCDRCSAA
jgi:Fur family ferric uptake transcriptional regulator